MLVNPVYRQYTGVPAPRKPGDNTTLKKLGRAIHAARTSAHLTQERMAELISVSTRTYQDIEAGGINPPTTTLIRIQKAIGCSWSDLLP